MCPVISGKTVNYHTVQTFSTLRKLQLPKSNGYVTTRLFHVLNWKVTQAALLSGFYGSLLLWCCSVTLFSGFYLLPALEGSQGQLKFPLAWPSGGLWHTYIHDWLPCEYNWHPRMQDSITPVIIRLLWHLPARVFSITKWLLQCWWNSFTQGFEPGAQCILSPHMISRTCRSHLMLKVFLVFSQGAGDYTLAS